MKICKGIRLGIIQAVGMYFLMMTSIAYAQTTCSGTCASNEICCDTKCYSKNTYATCCGNNNACQPDYYCCVDKTGAGHCVPMDSLSSDCCAYYCPDLECTSGTCGKNCGTMTCSFSTLSTSGNPPSLKAKPIRASPEP